MIQNHAPTPRCASVHAGIGADGPKTISPKTIGPRTYLPAWGFAHDAEAYKTLRRRGAYFKFNRRSHSQSLQIANSKSS